MYQVQVTLLGISLSNSKHGSHELLSSWQSVVLTLLGGVVATAQALLLAVPWMWPEAWWDMCVPSESVLVGYLLGSTGVALITIVQTKRGRGSTRLARQSFQEGAVVTIAVFFGAVVIKLGLLFTCVSSIIAGAAACVVGSLSALMAYGFGVGGATMMATGLFRIRALRTPMENHSI